MDKLDAEEARKKRLRLALPMPWETGAAGLVLSGEWRNPAPAAQPLAASEERDDVFDLTVAEDSLNEVSDLVPTRRERIANPARLARGWHQTAADERGAAMLRLLDAVSACGRSSSLHCQLAELQQSAQAQRRLLEDAVADKATGTIFMRLGSFLQFARWKRSSIGSGPTAPFREPEVYRYLCFLREHGAKPTTAQRALESLRWCSTIFGVPECLDATQSVRCRGAAYSAAMSRDLANQAPILKVEELKAVEEGVTALKDPTSRAFCGFIAFLVHGRLRYSDGMRITTEPFINDYLGTDGALIEASAEFVKAKPAQRLRRMTLPVAGCAMGVSRSGWAWHWLTTRTELDMSSFDVLMPTPDAASEGFHARPLRSAEASLWLRELLSRMPPFWRGRHVRPSRKSGGGSWATM